MCVCVCTIITAVQWKNKYGAKSRLHTHRGRGKGTHTQAHPFWGHSHITHHANFRHVEHTKQRRGTWGKGNPKYECAPPPYVCVCVCEEESTWKLKKLVTFRIARRQWQQMSVRRERQHTTASRVCAPQICVACDWLLLLLPQGCAPSSCCFCFPCCNLLYNIRATRKGFRTDLIHFFIHILSWIFDTVYAFPIYGRYICYNILFILLLKLSLCSFFIFLCS